MKLGQAPGMCKGLFPQPNKTGLNVVKTRDRVAAMTDENTRPAPRTPPLSWLLVVLGLAVVMLAGWRTLATSDIWTHIASGRDIRYAGIPRTATLTFALPADTPWVNASWLYDLGAATLWRYGGAKLLTLAHILAVMAAFLILAQRMLRKSGAATWAVAAGLALAAWLLLPDFSPQPALVAMLFCSMFIARMSHAGRWGVGRIALLVAQVFWTNLHPSFLLGPGIALLYAIDAARLERTGEKPEVSSRQLVIFSATLFAATLISPYGPMLHAWLAKVLFDLSRQTAPVTVLSFMQDFTSSPLLYSKYAAVALLGAGLLVIRQRLSIVKTATAVLGAFLLLRSPVPPALGAILVFPFAVQTLSALGTQSAILGRLGAPLALVALFALGALTATGKHLAMLGLTANRGLGRETSCYPTDAASAIGSKVAFPHRIINLPADGGFLATRLPLREIFCDTRASLYGSAFYERLDRALRGDDASLKEIETRWNPGAILINCAWPHSGAAVVSLKASGRWAFCYFDGTSALFVKNTLENQQFIRDRHLHAQGLRKLETVRRNYAAALAKGELRNPNNPQLAGAGRVFLALGRAAEAAAVYGLLASAAPNMHSAALGNGIALLQLGRATEAIPELQRAAEMRPRDPLPLLCLALAHRASGDDKASAASEAAARALSPDEAERFLKNPPLPRPSR